MMTITYDVVADADTLYPTDIVRTAPSRLLGEAEASVGAEREGVREVHSSSNVYWISGLAGGQTWKSFSDNPAKAFRSQSLSTLITIF